MREKRLSKINIIKKNTWLQNTHLDFKTIILFVYCWAFQLTTIEFCERELKISVKTCVDWNNFLREVCAFTLIKNPIKIGGSGMVVEIDESVFSKRKYNVGRARRNQWVFGGICRETKACFLVPVVVVVVRREMLRL
eukprot:Pompholyxophrys_punicea_v1_NODE_692_length_1452_cov_33.509664.p2 type:complete len:137 gc:universal NODE_692_length_1452_cov_33.509664:490-900(+)